MIKRIQDPGIVEKIYNDPEIKEFLCDDDSEEIGEYPIADNLYYLGHYDEGLKGVGMFIPVNSITVDCHIGFLRDYPPHLTRSAAKNMIEWIKKEGFKKMVCAIPQTSQHVIRFVQDLGYNLEGCSPKSFKKNGKLVDRILYGLEL